MFVEIFDFCRQDRLVHFKREWTCKLWHRVHVTNWIHHFLTLNSMIDRPTDGIYCSKLSSQLEPPILAPKSSKETRSTLSRNICYNRRYGWVIGEVVSLNLENWVRSRWFKIDRNSSSVGVNSKSCCCFQCRVADLVFIFCFTLIEIRPSLSRK